MDITLVKTKICSTCGHYSEVCTCKAENKNIVNFVDWIEEKYHDKEHVHDKTQCYKLSRPFKPVANVQAKPVVKPKKNFSKNNFKKPIDNT